MKPRIIKGTILGTVGYVLSPLSWWNDAFVNIPLAYSAAWLIGLLYRPAFGTAFIAGYWLTNLAGFFLMHKGVCNLVKEDCTNRMYLKKNLLKDLSAALLYTALMVALVHWKIIQPVGDYFR